MPTEAVLVMAWASLAYALPALFIAGVLVATTKLLKRPGWSISEIPAALLPIGVWVGFLINSHLRAVGIPATLLIQLPASAALAIGICYLLYLLFKPVACASMNSTKIWLFLQLLILCVAVSWLANIAIITPQRITIVPATAAAIFCLQGLRPSSSLAKPLIGAGCLSIITVMLFIGWPSFPEKAANKGEKPNVLLVTIDTLRADHLVSYGYTKGQTPNIDAMKGVKIWTWEGDKEIPVDMGL